MRVLQLVKTSVGAEWALQQMQDLLKDGLEVHVAMPIGGRYTESYYASGIQVHDIQYSLKRPYKTIRSLKKIVDEVKPDVIHSHFYLTTLIMRMALRKDSTPRLYQLPGPTSSYKIPTTIELWLAQKNDYWAGACRASCQAYIDRGISENRVFLAYYQGTPLEDVVFAKDEKKLRHELGLPDDALMVGMISYMYAPRWYIGEKNGIKGHEDFIDAIAIASKANTHIYGLCIGGAWNGAVKYEQKLKEYAKKKTDHVIFCGTRTNVPEIYPELATAVQPSHQENLGGAGQAFKYGCPIVSTNVGGLPDIVHDGVTGFLVNPNAPQELADAILKMVSDPVKAHEMMLAGREYYMKLKNDNKGVINRVYNDITTRK